MKEKIKQIKKTSTFVFSCIVAIEIAVFVEISCDCKYKRRGVGQLLRSIAAGFLFNDILGFPNFKLTGLIWKACWPFPSETDPACMYNFRFC